MKVKIGSNYHSPPVHRRDPTGRFQKIETGEAFEVTLSDYVLIVTAIGVVWAVYWWFN